MKNAIDDKKEDIIYLINNNFKTEEIIQSFEEELEIIQITDWKTKLKDLVEKIIEEQGPKPLSSFKDFEQKQNFIKKIKDKDEF